MEQKYQFECSHLITPTIETLLHFVAMSVEVDARFCGQE